MNKLLGHLQTNAFGLITNLSGVVSDFTSQKWSDMDRNSRGYALHQAGQAFASLGADILGFHI